ncbi:hypothetical protein OC835_004123, partial [Tilletia horrida]
MLSSIHEPTSDDIVPVSLTPQHVQDKLQPFLYKDFSYDHAKVMHTFTRLLAAAGSGDEQWSFADRSALLSKLCDPTKSGLTRIKEILLTKAVTKSLFQQQLLYQNGMVLVFMFMTSSTVLNTASASSTNQLYGILDAYFDSIMDVAQTGIRALMDSRGRELLGTDISSMVQVFKPIILLLKEYLDRFPAALASRAEAIESILSNLAASLKDWIQAMSAGSFQDGLAGVENAQRWANFAHNVLQDRIEKMLRALHATTSSFNDPTAAPRISLTGRMAIGEGQLQLLIRTFEPPGHLRATGPRHGNDHARIQDINVHPTSQEIVSTESPFVPYNFIGAPHHLDAGSPEQLLDIHFRLLREELVEPLRSSITAVSHELLALEEGPNQLSRLLSQGGGRFRAGSNCADLQIWGDGFLRFAEVTCNDRHGVVIKIAFKKHQTARAWDFQLERLLNHGALVGVITPTDNGESTSVALGLVRSWPDDIKRRIRAGELPAVLIEFFDTAAIHLAFAERQPKTQLLVEVRGVLYESIAPFLENLKAITPAQLPFADVLALPASAPATRPAIPPPCYAQNPAFSYDLSGLLRPGSLVGDGRLQMTIEDGSTENARTVLKEHGIVDDTQADAVVDTLTREVSIIQGPPGTGKSFTGVALINALLKSRVSPILIICMTNHALDSVLSKVLEQDLTKKIVRLGSRSKDERISSYSLETLVHLKGKTEDRGAKRDWRELKLAQEEMMDNVRKLKSSDVDAHRLYEWADLISPEHVQAILNVPQSLRPAVEEWAGFEHRRRSSSMVVFDFWTQGIDLDLRAVPQRPAYEQQDQEQQDRAASPDETAFTQNRFQILADSDGSDISEDDLWPCDEEDEEDGAQDVVTMDASSEAQSDAFEDALSQEAAHEQLAWPMIVRRGSVELLEVDTDVWSYSAIDRVLLVERWKKCVRETALSTLDDTCQKLEDARKKVQEHRNEERLAIMNGCDIIGATTNGAAKAVDLLKLIKPKVLLVEEAGQVLEAHILATLSQSIEHLILIGDHNQLRPQVTNYELSMENKRGRGHLHRLDLSLMERLAEESMLPISRIVTQRRMRPEICDLIRPVQQLEDHESVQGRQDIKGVAKNFFFFDHNYPESAVETSRTNESEADIAVDLVRHFVAQGYTEPGDICVIVAYLSQISKVKERLGRHQISIIVSDKDASALADAAAEDDEVLEDQQNISVVRQSLGASVRVATVDNFQGEEARIVILSLVRNRGADTDEQLANSRFLRKSGIGFLKSKNRAYVALSRARDGLFVLGNAELMVSQSSFWADVLERFEEADAIVQAIPIVCSRHPEKGVREVSEPGQLAMLSPNEKCGPCDFIIPVVELPCGHSATAVRCAKALTGTIWCGKEVDKTLPECGHHVRFSASSTVVICAFRPVPVATSAKKGAKWATSARLNAQSDATVGFCGEPCEQQTCAICASEDKRDQVVDLIMQTTLAEIDSTSHDLDSRTITLGCGHVFTVETLDGLFRLNDFYSKNADGAWDSTALIGPEFMTGFACPSCRQPAAAKRYGRPQKRAFLDAQERKQTLTADKTIHKLQMRSAGIDVDILASRFGGQPFMSKLSGERRFNIGAKGQKRFLDELDADALPAPASLWENLLHFGLSKASAQGWKSSTKPILDLNRAAEAILKQKTPHVHAWQAAVSQAYERISATLDPRDVRRDQKALQMARRAVAMPEPQSEAKFHLLSCLLILQSRVLLVNVAVSVAEQAKLNGDAQWYQFVHLLLSSGVHDAAKTYSRAQDSKHGKVALEAISIKMHFGIELTMDKLKLSWEKVGNDDAKQAQVGNKARQEVDQLRSDWASAMESINVDANLKEQAHATTAARFQAVEDCIKSRKSRKEELKMIISTLMKFNLDLGYGGHYYRCSNGHPFVIGDCGGAMEVASCPECGVPIGGGHHTLVEGNTRDTEMEQLA